MFIILIIIGIIALDQFTKFIVISSMTEHQSIPFINGFMDFTYKKNTGVAFGMLADQRLLYMIFTAIMLAAMFLFLIKLCNKHKIFLIAIAFMTGGGLGNMIDRLFRTDVAGPNFVVDFFEFKFVDFAVFNVADSFISIGAVLLLVFVLFFEKNNPIFEKKAETPVLENATEKVENESDNTDTE